MGKKNSKLNPCQIEDLVGFTNFNEMEVREWYSGFIKDCPKGKMSQKTFIELYKDFFPHGDADSFAVNIFRTFDQNKDGVIDFREFLCALSVTSRGSLEEKLGWAFSIYDIDDNGSISMDEMKEIIKTIYSTRGIEQKLGNNAIEEKTIQTFKRLDTNNDGKISLSEFVRGAKADPSLMDVLS